MCWSSSVVNKHLPQTDVAFQTTEHRRRLIYEGKGKDKYLDTCCIAAYMTYTSAVSPLYYFFLKN